MARVQRPPIQADIGAETVELDEPFRGVVATLAQAHKRAEPELVDVAMMWLDVIADGRQRDDAAPKAIFTKRVFEQLVLPDPGPASRGVPLVPFRRLTANAPILLSTQGKVAHLGSGAASAQRVERPRSLATTSRASLCS
jgi:hypothetical protein